MSWADKFNLLNEMNLLRIACALFFIPHLVGKFTVPQALQFSVEVGFKPPAVWMYLAGVIVAGMHTSEIFIENGRFHGGQIAADIAAKLSSPVD